jgi:hypothetical protein
MTDVTAITTPAATGPRPVAVRHMSFRDMLAMGNVLVRTGFLPEHIATGAQAAAIILTGRELGMEPMRALRSLTLVKGKVTEHADSQLARFKSDGGAARWLRLDATAAELWLRHPNGDEHTEQFTIEDAERAGLLKPSRKGEPSMFLKYPKAMLRSRCITAALKSLGWEGGAGVYDPSELAGEPPARALEPAAPPALVARPQSREVIPDVPAGADVEHPGEDAVLAGVYAALDAAGGGGGDMDPYAPPAAQEPPPTTKQLELLHQLAGSSCFTEREAARLLAVTSKRAASAALDWALAERDKRRGEPPRRTAGTGPASPPPPDQPPAVDWEDTSVPAPPELDMPPALQHGTPRRPDDVQV